MKHQEDIFKNEEGDKWFERNIQSSGIDLEERVSKDGIIASFGFLNRSPKNILEIGCSNGWRLEGLRRIYRCNCFGIDPSLKAINHGKAEYPEIDLRVSTADDLPYQDIFFDNVIMGFCLYLCDRDKLFKIAYEADRVLKDNGNLFILDFIPDFAYRNEYRHRGNISSYKMSYKEMFLWNPAYALIYREVFSHEGREYIENPDERIGIDVLCKNIDYAYPQNPY